MRKQFLVGNFMRAYSGSFRYGRRAGERQIRFDREWLEARFRERSNRARSERRRYMITLQLATIFALALPLAATQIEFSGGDSTLALKTEQETVTLQEIAQTVQRTLPPPPPRPPVPIVVADDELREDNDLDFDASLDIAEMTELPPPPVEANQEEEQYQEPEIFEVVEDLPEIIGGAAKLAADVKYPQLARQAGLQGLVVVKIIVNADGTPSDPVILKSPGSALDNAAVDAVMAQQFRPGRQRGRAVAAYMAIPVRFQLTSI